MVIRVPKLEKKITKLGGNRRRDWLEMGEAQYTCWNKPRPDQHKFKAGGCSG